jgi:ribosomal protein S12 methylthiotransferase accessory factor YcaO
LTSPAPPSFILPHRDAAWKIIKERFHAPEQTCDSLAKEPGVAALAQVARRLHAIADEVSHRLATGGE